MTDQKTTPPSQPPGKAPKAKKKKGPIRTEVVLPFAIVILLTWAYFAFLFDGHLRKLFEYAGYEVIGAEVNVAKVETSFIKGTFRVQGIQVTNSERPTHNMFEIGDIRFGVLWDGLLRAKVVVEEMAVEKILIGTTRKSPGRVKPPEPEVVEDPNAPSELEKKANEVKDKALNKIEDKYEGNVLADLAQIAGGTSADAQLQNIEGSIESKKHLQALDATYKEKQKKWDDKIKALPKPKEIEDLGKRLSQVKTKDFKTPQEVEASIKAIDSIVKEADAKSKIVQSANSELSADLKQLDKEVKDLDALVKKDIADLEKRFKIPKLDAKSISRSIFMSYLQPYLIKFHHYKGVAIKYIPPNVMKKDKDEPDQVQPRPRAKGIVYEFGTPRGYPAVWIKKVAISSQAGADPQAGNVAGQITNITTNQALIGLPTIARISGDFPGMDVFKFVSMLTIDNTKALSKISYDFGVGSYGIAGKDLVTTPEVKIGFNKARGGLTSTGELVGLKDFSFKLNNQFSQVDYNIAAQNSKVDEVLKAIFAGIPAVTLDAWGGGVLPGISLNVNSNLGPEIARGFEKQVQKKIDEARKKIEAYVNEQVGKERARIEGEINKFKSQIDGEVKKVQAQLDKQKSDGEAKANLAKKDAENKAKKQVEDQLKKSLGGKGVDDLKKKLGL